MAQHTPASAPLPGASFDEEQGFGSHETTQAEAPIEANVGPTERTQSEEHAQEEQPMEDSRSDSEPPEPAPKRQAKRRRRDSGDALRKRAGGPKESGFSK